MSRLRAPRSPLRRSPRPPTAGQLAELEDLRAQMRERYEWFEAQRASARMREQEGGPDS